MSPRRPALPVQPPTWMSDLGIPAACVSLQTAVGDGNAKFRLQKAPGDEVWCVRVDGCWLAGEQQKADYLFYCLNASGMKKVVLVELKGRHFSEALAQIQSTLGQLCKLGEGQGIHTGQHLHAPGHEATQSGGVRAYVILSKYRSTDLDQIAVRNIARQFRVIVMPRSQLLSIHGVDRLP